MMITFPRSGPIFRFVLIVAASRKLLGMRGLTSVAFLALKGVNGAGES